MNANWQTVRVFISSTFRDMQAERDHLVRFVFPLLREEFSPYRIHVDDFDLRWGVTSDQDVLSVCHSIIDECQPRFLCLLGQRYGTVPRGHTHSITEDEIEYGVMSSRSNREGAFFYFRNDAATTSIPAEFADDYRATENSEEGKKLGTLKGRILAAGFQPRYYSANWDTKLHRLVGLEAMGEQVFGDLARSIRTDSDLQERFASAPMVDEFAEEAGAMETEIQRHLSRFVPGSREDSLTVLEEHARGRSGSNYLCLHAPSGMGKSALLAWFCETFPAKEPESILIPHFVGATPRSAEVQGLLRHLYHALSSAAHLPPEPPADPTQLEQALRDRFKQVAQERSVAVAIDALDQLDDFRMQKSLSWLWTDLPPNVRIVMSLTEDRALEAIRNMGIAARVETLGQLQLADVSRVVDRFLKRYGKHLDETQRADLLKKGKIGLPLYLLIALEELRTLGLYQEISAKIAELPESLEDLIGKMFDRLILDPGFRDEQGDLAGPRLVPRFCGLLAAGRSGLTEGELRQLTLADDPLRHVEALQRLLKPYLVRRGELVDFQHRAFRRVATDRFLSGPDASRRIHGDLADYLLQRGWEYPRALSELPYHLFKEGESAGRYTRLIELLDGSSHFIQEKWRRTGRLDDIDRDYRLGLQACRNARDWEAALPIVGQSSSFRALASIIDHADLLVAASRGSDRRELISRLESAALVEREPLSAATLLTRLALSIEEPHDRDTFSRRLMARLADWRTDNKLSADHASALSACLTLQGASSSARGANEALANIKSPRIRFSGCRLAVRNPARVPDEFWSRFGELLWECVKKEDDPAGKPAEKTAATTESELAFDDAPWFRELQPEAIWHSELVTFSDVLKLVDRLPAAARIAILRHTPSLTTIAPARPTEETIGISRSIDRVELSPKEGVLGHQSLSRAVGEPPSEQSALFLRAATTQSIFLARGNLSDKELSEQAMIFLAVALRIEADQAFMEVCSHYCRNKWHQLAHYIVLSEFRVFLALCQEPRAWDRLAAILRRTTEPGATDGWADESLFRLGLHLRKLGDTVDLSPVLHRLIETDFAKQQVVGIVDIAARWLFPEAGYGSARSLTVALSVDEVTESILWLLGKIPAFAPSWFVVDTVFRLVALLLERGMPFNLRSILDRLLELLAGLPVGHDQSLCLMELAALGTNLDSMPEADGFFAEFHQLALQQDGPTLQQVELCVEALARSRVIPHRFADIEALLACRWNSKEMTDSCRVQMDVCRMLARCGFEAKFADRLTMLGALLTEEQLHGIHGEAHALAELIAGRPGFSDPWQEFVIQRIPAEFTEEKQARLWCEFVEQAFVSIPNAIVDLLSRRLTAGDLLIKDALEVARPHPWLDGQQLLTMASAGQLVLLPSSSGKARKEQPANPTFESQSILECRTAPRSGGDMSDFDYDGMPDWINRQDELTADPWKTEVQVRMRRSDGSSIVMASVAHADIITLARRLCALLPDDLLDLAPTDRVRYVNAVIDQVLAMPSGDHQVIRLLLARLQEITYSIEDSGMSERIQRLIDGLTQHSLNHANALDYCEAALLPSLERMSSQAFTVNLERLRALIVARPTSYLQSRIVESILAAVPPDQRQEAAAFGHTKLGSICADPRTRCWLRLPFVAFLVHLNQMDDAVTLIRDTLADLDAVTNEFARFEMVRQVARSITGQSLAPRLTEQDVDHLIHLVLEPAIQVGTEHLRAPVLRSVGSVLVKAGRGECLSQLFDFCENYLHLQDAQARVLHAATGDPTLRDGDLVSLVRSLSDLTNDDLSDAGRSRADQTIQQLDAAIETPVYRLLSLGNQLFQKALSEEAVQRLLGEATEVINRGGILMSEFGVPWLTFMHSQFRGRGVAGPHWHPVINFAIPFMELAKDIPACAFLLVNALPDVILTQAVQGGTPSEVRESMFGLIPENERVTALWATVRLGLCYEDDLRRVDKLPRPKDRATMYRFMLAGGSIKAEPEVLQEWFHDQLDYWAGQPPVECLNGLAALARLGSRYGMRLSQQLVASHLLAMTGERPRKPNSEAPSRRFIDVLSVVCGAPVTTEPGTAS